METHDQLNLQEIGSSINKKEPLLETILNTLPFGISVQTKDRKVIFENDKIKELVGSYASNHCFSRWNYIPGEGKTICKDCPATIALLDHNMHKIFRKTIKRDDTNLFIEIQVLPIIEKNGEITKYIEVINDVSNDEVIKSIVDKPISELINNLQFSVSKYGFVGGEIIQKDDLSFFKKTDESIQRLTMFTYIGVFQNNFKQEGFFGPLPVIDLPSKCMMVYSFRAEFKENPDPRREGKEPCLLLIYFDRENFFMFERRFELSRYLNEKLENIKLSDLTEVWFNSFKKDFNDFFKYVIEQFCFKK